MGAEINKPEGLTLSNDRTETNNESGEDKNILGTKAGIQYNQKKGKILSFWLPETPEKGDELDHAITKKILENTKIEEANLRKQLGILTEGKRNNGETENNIKDIDIQDISNKEFIENISEGERLKYITTDSIDSSKVANGEVKDITFTFTNKDLYLMTTAGQVLPPEVLKVNVKGVEFTRINNSLKGEFYSTNNQRLKIHGGGFGGEDTNLTVTELRSQEEVNLAGNQLDSSIDGYRYGLESNKLAVLEALEKGIDVKIFMTIVNRRFENPEELMKKNPKEYNARLEQYSTEILRAMSQNKEATQSGKYSIETSAEIFKRLTPASWEKSMGDSGFSSDDINEYKQNVKYHEVNFAKEYGNNLPGEFVSHPAEKSVHGTTLCSKTARLNLYRLGVPYTAVAKGTSALKAFNSLGGSIQKSNFTNLEGQDGDIADIYCEASSEKNKEYGHRLAGQKIDGKWFVLDPYLPILGYKTTQLIPLEAYTSYQHNRGRKMWGAKIFTPKS